MSPSRSAILVLLSLSITGCSGICDHLPPNREIYRESALREGRNPVVVIHGILGARLEQRSTGKVVWGAFTDDGIDIGTPEGVRALAVPLPDEGGAMAYDPATADVYPSGPLDALEIGILFNTITVDVYLGILQSLGVGGYVDRVYVDPGLPEYAEDHFTCHTFFYDWRRDNVENAIALGRFLAQKRVEIDTTAIRRIAKLRAEGSDESLARAQDLSDWLGEGYRFDLVAHSMGGLVARYYLRYGMEDLPADGGEPEVSWAGAAEVDRLILIATPSLGSVQGFNRLINGFEPAFFLPEYSPAVLGTMPSVYQLLPRIGNRVLRDDADQIVDLDLFDPEVWDRNDWGLLDPEVDQILQWLMPEELQRESRRTRALSYLAWCLRRAKRFHSALDKDAEVPCPAEIRLFAGDALDTVGRVRIERDGDRLVPHFDGDDVMLFGDDTVPRYSALGDRSFGRAGEATQHWIDSPIPLSSVTFLPDDHVGLTSNPMFTDNLLFFLLQQPPRPR